MPIHQENKHVYFEMWDDITIIYSANMCANLAILGYVHKKKKRENKTRVNMKVKKVTTTRETDSQYQCSHVLWQTFNSLYHHQNFNPKKFIHFRLDWVWTMNKFNFLYQQHIALINSVCLRASNQAKTLKSKSFLINACCFLFIFESFKQKPLSTLISFYCICRGYGDMHVL